MSTEARTISSENPNLACPNHAQLILGYHHAVAFGLILRLRLCGRSFLRSLGGVKLVEHFIIGSVAVVNTFAVLLGIDFLVRDLLVILSLAVQLRNAAGIFISGILNFIALPEKRWALRPPFCFVDYSASARALASSMTFC